MSIADTKTRITITIDRELAEQVEEVSEQESRSTSNVIQLLVEHGLRDRGKYRWGPQWCMNIVGKRIVFECGTTDYDIRTNEFDEVDVRDRKKIHADDDGDVTVHCEYIPTLRYGRVLDVFEWNDSMRLVVEMNKQDEFDDPSEEKKLVFLTPDDILSVVDEREKTLFLRSSKKAVLNARKANDNGATPSRPVERTKNLSPKKRSKKNSHE